MKTKLAISLLICLFVTGNAEAQIFKKLKDKVAKAVSKKDKEQDSTIQDPAYQDSIAMTKLQKGFFVKLFNSDTESTNTGNISIGETSGEPQQAQPDNNIELPQSYNFSYRAILHIKNKDGTFKTEYYLQPKATYHARKLTQKNFPEIAVYDNKRHLVVHFAEIDGEKWLARKKMNIFTKARLLGAYIDAPDKQVTSIGEKTILGYNCKGYQITSKEGTTKLWITNEAPATLFGAMFTKRAKTADSPFNVNTMIMEVEFESVESSDKNYQLQCTTLQPNTLVLNKNEYIE